MTIKVAINGFGRIGRLVLRQHIKLSQNKIYDKYNFLIFNFIFNFNNLQVAL